MKTIWKYQVYPIDSQTLLLPKDVEFLAVQAQRTEMILWAKVDPQASEVPFTIRVIGTGHPIVDEPGAYLDTVQDLYGMVWHIFYKPGVHNAE